MPRDLDTIRNLKEMENLQAAKARFWSDRIEDPDLRRVCTEIAREHGDHQGRLDALEHQLGRSVMASPYQSVVSDRYQFQPEERIPAALIQDGRGTNRTGCPPETCRAVGGRIVEDRMIAGDLLEGVRHATLAYCRAALSASDEELKKSFLGFQQSEMSLHSRIYNLMKNRGWYPQEAGDLTMAGGFRGGFYPHGRGQQIPVDEPDRAPGLSRFEVENGPGRGGHSYKQDEEGSRRYGEPSGRTHYPERANQDESGHQQHTVNVRQWQNTPQQAERMAGRYHPDSPEDFSRFYEPRR